MAERRAAMFWREREHGGAALGHATLAFLVFLLSMGGSCRKRLATVKIENATTPSPPLATAHVESNQPPRPLPTRVDIPVVGEDADRWLFVEKERGGAAGAWATGSFDRDRNKLTIKTHDTERFVIDISRIKINWSKPVVLSIDGINTGLRRREDPLLRFVRDDLGKWIVLEPEPKP